MSKKILFWIVLGILFVPPIPTWAGTLVNSNLPGKEVILWSSQEGFLGCMAEVQANGIPGNVCTYAIRGILTSGTQARKIPGSGYRFPKVQILSGPLSGTVGHVPMEYYRE